MPSCSFKDVFHQLQTQGVDHTITTTSQSSLACPKGLNPWQLPSSWQLPIPYEHWQRVRPSAAV